MKIFITGCARSGTTVLCRMFHAFGGIEVINDEVPLQRIIDHHGPVVGKRTVRSFLSNINCHQEFVVDIKNHDIKIVNILRDGRDVIESGKAPARRWLASVEAYFKYQEMVAVTVVFEDLILCPDKVQGHIINAFGLHPCALFSDYPRFVPAAGFAHAPKGDYQARPLDAGKINKNYDWKDKVVPEEQDRFLNYCDKIKKLRRC